MDLEKLRFLNEEEVHSIAETFGTPVFVYSESELIQRAEAARSFPNAFGITPRFAMKANPNGNILKIFRKHGIHIDASSEFEVERALHSGYSPEEILFTGQQPPSEARLREIVGRGTDYNACSLYQLELYGKCFPGTEISMRINPGLGSGGTKKTDVGGTTSSFGIWHESIPKVKEILNKYSLKVKRIHTHIGSGSDPEVWKAVAHYTLEYAEIFPETRIVNLGGGFKVGRMSDEISTDFQKIGAPVKELFLEFERKQGRKLHLEIEPGTSLVANCGSLISRIMDKVHTGPKGMKFIKLDSGMDSNTRPSLYGSRHPLIAVGKKPSGATEECVVVGHCCESGDVFTQEMGGEPMTRKLSESEIGDYMVMEGVGAYCASMSTKNYNSFPEVPEVLISEDKKIHLIRKRQELSQIFQNEILLP
ncbi:MAG: diaminopimelate decarboxylase [Leptospiraceae bacterium]|nr:diaminopimelate decarboxylase [Leptospiraceae bacterium]